MMLDSEFVTIVIVSRNSEKTIERAIMSAVSNSRPPDQIVIGENDSDDKSYELLCNLLGAEKIEQDGQTGWPPVFEGKIDDVPVKIFRKRFSTNAHSLNACIQMSPQQTSIFGFMQPDSWYEPGKIQKSLYVLKEFASVGCVLSDYLLHYEDGRTVREFRKSFSERRSLCENDFDLNFLIRKIVFQKMRGAFSAELEMCEEYDLILKTSETGLIYHIPEPLHNLSYREKPVGIDNVENMIQQVTANRRKSNAEA